MPRNGNNLIEELYRQEYNRLLRTACRLTGDRTLAENMVQETFLLAVLHQKELASHPKPGAWLFQALRKLIWNEQRSASRQDLPLDEVAEVPAGSLPPLEELLPSGLGPEERALLIWRFEERLSCGEIAERLCISEAACRKRISRALARCRRLLEEG